VRTGAAGESALLLLDVVDLLNEGRIAYAVIGALAASVHGVVRASLDADVLLSIGIQQAANLERLLSAVFRTEMTRGDFEDPIAGVLKITDSYDLGLLRRLADRYGRSVAESLEQLLAAVRPVS
jgi:hypothetical protein